MIEKVFKLNAKDRAGAKYVLNNPTTKIVSIQAKSTIDETNNNPIILAFATSIPIYDSRKLFKGLIVDYIGTTTESPNDVIIDFNYAVFSGK